MLQGDPVNCDEKEQTTWSEAASSKMAQTFAQKLVRDAIDQVKSEFLSDLKPKKV